MSKRLLIETRMNSLALNESKSRQVHPGCLGTLDGPCADLKNATRNGNFYSRKLWENVFADPIVKESLEDRILIGELDHPGDRLETKAVNAAIVMTSYEFDDNNGLLLGTFDILDTPNGRILKSLLDYGCKIGVSSRGEGDVTTVEGVDHVDEDSFNFMGFDAVVLPAVKAAKPALRESLDRETKSLKESLTQQVSEATTMAELDLIKRVVGAMDLPDSDSLMESVNNKAQELTEGTTGSSNLLEDLEKATSQIQGLNDEVGKLKEELTTCKSRISKLMSSRQRLVSELSSQRKKYEELSKDLNCYAFESTANSNKAEALQSQLSESLKEIKRLRNQIRTIESSAEADKAKISSLEESLSQAQSLAQSKITEVSHLKTKVEGLESGRSKKLTESQSQVGKLRESLSSAKSKLTESQKKYDSFLRGYVSEKCDLLGLDSSAIFESLKPDMSKGEVDRLIESYHDRVGRYSRLPIASDPLLESVGRQGSVSFNGTQKKVDEESQATLDFMLGANQYF